MIRRRRKAMAGRWSRGWEEYKPCGIGLTSHSLPSAAQDMWGWTFLTPLILFLWVGRPQHTITALETQEREDGNKSNSEDKKISFKKNEKAVRKMREEILEGGQEWGRSAAAASTWINSAYWQKLKGQSAALKKYFCINVQSSCSQSVFE